MDELTAAKVARCLEGPVGSHDETASLAELAQMDSEPGCLKHEYKGLRKQITTLSSKIKTFLGWPSKKKEKKSKDSVGNKPAPKKSNGSQEKNSKAKKPKGFEVNPFEKKKTKEGTKRNTKGAETSAMASKGKGNRTGMKSKGSEKESEKKSRGSEKKSKQSEKGKKATNVERKTSRLNQESKDSTKRISKTIEIGRSRDSKGLEKRQKKLKRKRAATVYMRTRSWRL